MIPDNFKKLIEKLLVKTIAGQVIWNETGNGKQFKVQLPKGAITIDRYWVADEYGDPNVGVVYIDIEILNENGQSIERLSFPEHSDDGKVLLDLYDAARRFYYKVEETFKNIINELDTDKIIGKQVNKNSPEDLPF